MDSETSKIVTKTSSQRAQSPTQPLNPGTTLTNRYIIDSVIGVGGMGAVYRGRDLHFPNVSKVVAVKEMVNTARDPIISNTIIRNFEREANILATLDHPAIPRIYDYFSQNQCSYLILEFVNGNNLEVKLKEGPIPEEKIVIWAIEICEVLHYLHTHQPEPIIFRDLKPSNIMVNTHDHVVLIDFGIAKSFDNRLKGTMIGTEGYSPPEQYRGEATPLADIYSLGATLHHLLTRRDPRLEPPFSFSERPIRQLNQNVTPELEDVIYKALQYNPEERFPSAKAMQEAILVTADKQGISQFSPVTTSNITRLKDNVKVLWSYECEDEIRGTPAYNNGVVYFGSYDHNFYAFNSATGKMLWKYATDGGIVSKPIVYGDNVYFGSEDQRLHVISIRSGRVNWTYFTGGPIRSSPNISEGYIYIGSDDGNIHAISPLTGRPAWQFDAGSPIRSTPLVFQESIYFGTENGDFMCLNLQGTANWHFKAKRSITSSPIAANGIIYFGSVDSNLYALDAKSGWVIWRLRLDKGIISTPFITENLVFIGVISGMIYAIDARSSKEIWCYKTDHQVTSSPVVANNCVYCGSVDGNLYCLDQKTGHLNWKFPTDGPITGTPVVENNMLFFGSTDHHFYSLKCDPQSEV